MKRATIILLLIAGVSESCQDLLEPQPVALQVDNLVLNEPADVPNVEIGLYSRFRPIAPECVIAGDFTADMLVNNGTFSNFRELGTKQITSANSSISALWGSIYATVYVANFILERLPEISGVPSTTRARVLATAHFLRGYAYFIGAYTFGGIPAVTTTSIDANRNIPRASKEEILQMVLDDYNEALGYLPAKPANPGYASEYAVHAALARYYLYLGDWAMAEQFASNVITSGNYELDNDFSDIVTKDFPDESIFEVGYTIADDPGTSSTIGLNNLFVGRREIIPSNQAILALASSASGDRFQSVTFNSNDLGGSDNGWSVAKYGTADADNNNIVVFRLAEMYLIRAEARAQQGKVTGAASAQTDINALRTRANAVPVPSLGKNQMLLAIENERRYELAFEGHRWYDLVRTGRASAIMSVYSQNWRDDYELWPIPQREILNNPSLTGQQNPGY